MHAQAHADAQVQTLFLYSPRNDLGVNDLRSADRVRGRHRSHPSNEQHMALSEWQMTSTHTHTHTFRLRLRGLKITPHLHNKTKQHTGFVSKLPACSSHFKFTTPEALILIQFITRKGKGAWIHVVKEAKTRNKTKSGQATAENMDKTLWPFPDGNCWWRTNVFRVTLKLPVLCCSGNSAFQSKCNLLFDSFSSSMAMGIKPTLVTFSLCQWAPV